MGERMFVAVVPPAEVVEHLDEFVEPRRGSGPLRWSPAEQFHVTLAFLADVPDRVVEPLVEGLGRAACRRTPFRAALAGGGAFPDPSAGKVLYAALALDSSAGIELDRLASGMRGEAAHAGTEVDGGRFVPHVTLARTQRRTEMTRWLRVLEAYRGPAWTVDAVEVVVSHLGEGPRGRARHETLAVLPLGPDRGSAAPAGPAM